VRPFAAESDALGMICWIGFLPNLVNPSGLFLGWMIILLVWCAAFPALGHNAVNRALNTGNPYPMAHSLIFRLIGTWAVRQDPRRKTCFTLLPVGDVGIHHCLEALAVIRHPEVNQVVADHIVDQVPR